MRKDEAMVGAKLPEMREMELRFDEDVQNERE